MTDLTVDGEPLTLVPHQYIECTNGHLVPRDPHCETCDMGYDEPCHNTDGEEANAVRVETTAETPGGDAMKKD